MSEKFPEAQPALAESLRKVIGAHNQESGSRAEARGYDIQEHSNGWINYGANFRTHEVPIYGRDMLMQYVIREGSSLSYAALHIYQCKLEEGQLTAQSAAKLDVASRTSFFEQQGGAVRCTYRTDFLEMRRHFQAAGYLDVERIELLKQVADEPGMLWNEPLILDALRAPALDNLSPVEDC